MEIPDHDGFVVVEGRSVGAGGDRVQLADRGAGFPNEHADGTVFFL